MARGFAFSLDAMLAAVLLAMAVGGFYFLSSQVELDSASVLIYKKQADDTLSVLDKSGALSGGNASSMNSTLALALPSGAGWNLTVECYSYSSGYALNTTLGVGSDPGASKLKVASERLFICNQTNGTDRYGRAKLVLFWAKGY